LKASLLEHCDGIDNDLHALNSVVKTLALSLKPV
jgi:hypothetical protein